IFDRLYSTNLSYIPEELKNKDLFVDVDCSAYLAEIIDAVDKQEELEPLWHIKKNLLNKIQKKMRK
ncbi:MAG: hypothetical protein K2L98_03770, partial [Bacilli bacterium]|nr:hypothetical protein [Bacilli bacterium]